MHPFRAAIESGDLPGAMAMLADDVVFRGPVVSEPCRGRDAVVAVLARAGRAFEDFRYVREIGGPGERDHALLFEARVGDRHVQGCDFLHTADDGSIGEFTVMVRPLSAALALGEDLLALSLLPGARAAEQFQEQTSYRRVRRRAGCGRGSFASGVGAWYRVVTGPVSGDATPGRAAGRG